MQYNNLNYLSESIKSGTYCKLASSIRFVYCVLSSWVAEAAFVLIASNEAARSANEDGKRESTSAPGC